MKKLLSIMVLSVLVGTAFAQPGYPSRLVVAADGTGDYTKIQEAIDAVRAYSPVALTIYIKNGIYKEKLIVPSWVSNISFIGESRDSTIITNDDYSGKFMSKDTLNNKAKFSTFNSYTIWIQGNDVTLLNLTIQNSSGPVGQAVALHADGDRLIVKNCKLLSHQDTLLTAGESSRQYYEGCYIEGTTDFIFGPATAVFKNCTIRSLKDSYITAASTPEWKKFGYVFLDCKLEADPVARKVYLGRPWRAFAKTVFIRTEMGNHILPAGWDNWRNPENEKTAFYAEYESSGPGKNEKDRVKWSHQLSKKEAAKYTLDNIFAGTSRWNPVEGSKN